MILYAAIMKTIDSKKDEEFLEEHISYLNKYIDSGEIYAKGPFLDHSGGLVIYNVGSIEEAKAIIDNDPAIVNNSRTYELKEWRSNFEG